MRSEQESARVAAVRLGRKTGHGIYGYDERGAIRLPTPAMARAYAELLAARPFRLTTFPNDVRSGSGSCACRRNQQ
jgi:hypothetical protein